MDRVRWGIIGVGDVTEVKSGPGFRQAEGSELVAVMRRNGDLARDYARRHGVPKAYDDADALIADPEVDAVYIATPPDSHSDYAIRVLDAGKPVYIEKPMGRTGAECRRVLDAADRAGVPVFVAFYRRTMPRFELARELIATELGEVGSVLVRYQKQGEPIPSRGRRGGSPRPSPAVGSSSTSARIPSTGSTTSSARSAASRGMPDARSPGQVPPRPSCRRPSPSTA